MSDLSSCKQAVVEVMDTTISLLIRPDVYASLVAISVLLLILIRMRSVGGLIGVLGTGLSLVLVIWIGAFIFLKTVANEEFRDNARSLIACIADGRDDEKEIPEKIHFTHHRMAQYFRALNEGHHKQAIRV